MIFSFANLGPIKSAEITLAPLTVVCGKNNTGKTYLSYSLFGLSSFMCTGEFFPISSDILDELILKGTAALPLTPSQDILDEFTQSSCKHFQKMLPLCFAADPKHFSEASFGFKIDVNELKFPTIINAQYTSGSLFSLSIQKEKKSDQIHLTLVMDPQNSSNKKMLKEILSRHIGEALRRIYIIPVLQKNIFASTERTGTLIFRDELTPARGNNLININHLLEKHSDVDTLVENITPLFYPLPIVNNINFIKSLRSISLQTSSLTREHPELLTAFDRISGGAYSVNEKGLFFSPSDSPNTKLTMEEASSSVRSLILISFWIRHLAASGDTLMVDEPEMNLHPDSQRKLARWIVMLINSGVNVFVTTHSDYFIKELNTMIMLYNKRDNSKIKELMSENGITPRMLLPPSKIKIYVATRSAKQRANGTYKLGDTTIKEAKVDKHYGCSVSSFDNTIDEMINLQSNILLHG